jgi:hypothetical protein
MPQQRIIRVRRVDGDAAAFSLVSAASNGPHPLDLKLVATEGENAYVGSGKLPCNEVISASPALLCDKLAIISPLYPNRPNMLYRRLLASSHSPLRSRLKPK